MSIDPEPWRPSVLLLSCEHGGRDIPSGYEHLFRDAHEVLESHRGYDLGALPVALEMAARIPAPVIFSTVTRLLIDTNRSATSPDALSEFTRGLPREARDRIIDQHHTPHRACVSEIVSAAVDSGRRVLHVGVHSCVDTLGGRARELDVSLLFDERRAAERELCERWRRELERLAPDLRFPFNEPYNGADDGLTTTLRDRFDPSRYLGIEVELRQGLVGERAGQKMTAKLLVDSLRAWFPATCES
ncbi:MAG: N-formylglutamate amidohydrolase [Phycisphaerales bacterium]